MDEKQFLALLEEILEVDPGSLAITDQLSEYDWDSLAVLGFISAIDSELDLSLDADKLSRAESPAQLLGLVNAAS